MNDDDWRVKPQPQGQMANNDDNLTAAICIFKRWLNFKEYTTQAVLAYVTTVQVDIDVLNDNVSCVYNRAFIVATWLVTWRNAKSFATKNGEIPPVC